MEGLTNLRRIVERASSLYYAASMTENQVIFERSRTKAPYFDRVVFAWEFLSDVDASWDYAQTYLVAL